MTEIVHTLHRWDLTESQDYLVSIPEGVKDAIGRHINRLSEDRNQTLSTASVIGREFDFTLLRTLRSEISYDRLLETLEEALAARVIEELPQALGRQQSTHALIQETLSGEMSTIGRARLHARLGEALEELYAANIEAHASELAYHFSRAESVLGPEKLIRYSLLAGHRALATYAYEEALTYYERGLAAKGIDLASTEPVKDHETAALLFGLGQAQIAKLPMVRQFEAADSLGRAFNYYAQAGDVNQFLEQHQGQVIVSLSHGEPLGPDGRWCARWAPAGDAKAAPGRPGVPPEPGPA